MEFKIVSPFSPTGDQPEAIAELTHGIKEGLPAQTLLGVTGSGKTFTMANVIEQVQKPTLILSHNKTLAAQLYSEFKNFFPENAVEYFVSYYDYYQPEAYIPRTDTYIEKDLAINEEIDRLRLSATSSLLSGRKDIIVVSSVSCLYGIGNPEDFHSNTIEVKVGGRLERNDFLRRLVDGLYSRNEIELHRGNFRVKGDTVDVYPAYQDEIVRVTFWGDEIDSIESVDPSSGHTISRFDAYNIYPANIFVTTKERINRAVDEIALDLGKQVEFFKSIGKELEAKRLYERVTYDLEMIKEVGYCSGIENYSRHLSLREAGSTPFTLIDFFPEDFLIIADESHVSIPQIRAMYEGDRSRKTTLVDFGFRLPSALDNRPLKFAEFESKINQMLFVSATPSVYEKEHSQQTAEQIIRPTGLLDPEISVRPIHGQIDDLLAEVRKTTETGDKVLVTTLTKKMAERLTDYLREAGVRVRYLHSDIDTLERLEIIRDLRMDVFDVLVGINLLREGLDIPEVSLVAILDADKEGFLRSETSLIQTIGRAARNAKGRVIMYADVMTESMDRAITETNRRRCLQQAHNEEHGIIPQTIQKKVHDVIQITKAATEKQKFGLEKDPESMSEKELKQLIAKLDKEMKHAALELQFERAAELRDKILEIKKLL